MKENLIKNLSIQEVSELFTEFKNKGFSLEEIEKLIFE